MTSPSPTVPPDLSIGQPEDPVAALGRQLEALVRQNVANLKELQAGGATFDQAQLINGRIDSLMQSIAQAFGPQGQLWLLQARLAFEEGMAQNLASAKAEGRKAILAQAGNFSPSAIRELARQTGTFGGL